MRFLLKYYFPLFVCNFLCYTTTAQNKSNKGKEFWLGYGHNDKWAIPGLAPYPEARILLFNCWGEKIFETKEYINNPWNGTYKRLIQPNGVYIYLIQLADDKKKVIKGAVTLIR